MKELLKKVQDFQLESFGKIRSAIFLNVYTDFFTMTAIDGDNIINGFICSSDTNVEARKTVNNFIKAVNKYEHKIRK